MRDTVDEIVEGIQTFRLEGRSHTPHLRPAEHQVGRPLSPPPPKRDVAGAPLRDPSPVSELLWPVIRQIQNGALG